ncbi:hypothetical protein NED98_08055 [Sphingomonas sp. MMSM20]|nr:hypothetical protein [Sphingomonas lycopersici]
MIVFGINLLPAFGPPTWSIIVFYGLNSDVPTAAIVLISAAAAASGRLALAHGFRYLRGRLPKRLKGNLEGARQILEHRRHGVIIGLGLFALSPLPSAQLFEAAGLAGIRLLGFTAAFFTGRLISYSVYAASAKTLRGTSLGGAFANSLTSPWGIALQVGMILLLAGLAQVDWRKFAPHADAREREGELP